MLYRIFSGFFGLLLLSFATSNVNAQHIHKRSKHKIGIKVRSANVSDARKQNQVEGKAPKQTNIPMQNNLTPKLKARKKVVIVPAPPPPPGKDPIPPKVNH